jgi:predicted NUDIX family phosphoesterase
VSAKVLICNYTAMGGPLLEVSIYTRAAKGLTPDNAISLGIGGELVSIEGAWAVRMTQFKLAPGEEREIWVHDLQFFLTKELPS